MNSVVTNTVSSVAADADRHSVVGECFFKRREPKKNKKRAGNELVEAFGADTESSIKIGL
ncbi:CLUMA_CG003975, isoform A [Clunio marinus]|uniref:CLUMA_CG003975, isoform A n=1 Tax=Clunio marinus TaxID=568069 RepID=A0A1J1HQC5_9DIPT|nr:CLUMA_CG003975, isoform A [Clunio marinus]